MLYWKVCGVVEVGGGGLKIPKSVFYYISVINFFFFEKTFLYKKCLGANSLQKRFYSFFFVIRYGALSTEHRR